LFSDIEGSTRLLQQLGVEGYGVLLKRQRGLQRVAFGEQGGYEVDCEGDGFFVAFASAGEAVAAAAAAQRALASESWPTGCDVRVRMGVHSGEPLLAPPTYVGLDVHRAARIMQASHGGQVLLSQATAKLLDERFQLRDLGEHRLKDLLQPVRLYQLLADGLEADFPPLQTLENRQTNLPLQADALIGREQELRELRALLTDSSVRLLTLTGAGGIGKTRLALHAAAKLTPVPSDGVFLVTLATIRDPAVVVQTIAQTLAVHERGGEPLLETLIDYLRDRQLLLVLDNFEQVASASPAVATLLVAAPRLRVIVTSRIRLRLAGEQLYRVQPLAVPDLGCKLGTLTEFDAVRLFIERAQAVASEFRIDDSTAPPIAEICVRLDGLPLAIELAAARIGLLSPQELLQRLSGRLDLLSGGGRDLEERQQTLRATIDWSHALLTPAEQQLFADLAVFAGGCTLEGVEAVCGAGPEVLDTLGGLVENSLLNRSEHDDGESRYWMFETIREYARERLAASGREDDLRRRQAGYLAVFAEETERFLFREGYMHLLGAVEREHENARAAVEWTIETGELDLGMRIVAALWRAWRGLGYLTEPRGWMTTLCEKSCAADSVARVRLLNAAADLAGRQGEAAETGLLAEQALAVSRKIGYEAGTIWSLLYLGLAAWLEGDFARCYSLADEAVWLAENLGDDETLMRALSVFGSAAADLGRLEEAGEAAARTLALARKLGALDGVMNVLVLRAIVHVRSREYDEAVTVAAKANSIARYQMNSEYNDAFTTEVLGLALLFSGDTAHAAECYGQALKSFHRLGQKLDIAGSLLALAAIAAERGRRERPARLRAAALSVLTASGIERDFDLDYRRIDQRYLQPWLAEFDRTTLERWELEGRAMTLDEAIDYALEPNGGAPPALTDETVSAN
jgi:predicted ATPase